MSTSIRNGDIALEEVHEPDERARSTRQSLVIGDIEVAITVLLGSARCTIGEVMDFAPGAIVPLSARADAPVHVLVNGTALAGGDIVELEDGSLAVEIAEIFERPRTENPIA
jgi:flagellar motor switch protein FliN/FliY